MRQKMQLIKKTIIFGIAIMLASCSEDLYDDQINESNIKIQRISMNDSKFKENYNLMKSMNNLLKDQSKNASSRYEYYTEYDFFIDEENGVYLEKDNLESYTFPAYKNETDSLITNVIFNKTVNGDYDVIVAKYDLLESVINELTKEELMAADVECVNITNRLRGPELICFESQEYVMVPIKQGELTGVFGYEGIWVTTYSYCYWSSTSGGGGDGSSGSSGSSGNGTGTGGNNGGGVLTVPVGGGGGGDINDEQDFVPPCPGNPVENPKICPSSPGNLKGGTYGCTRKSNTNCGGITGKKKHGGVDIKISPLERLYFMHSGTVVNKRSTFEYNQYVKNSLGNFVEIESLINGQTIRIKYCHLGYVPNFELGYVEQGWPLGLSGKSGNAAASGVTSHLHIQAKKKVGNSWVEIDPLPLFDTNFNPTTFQPSGSKTNCQ